MELANQGVTDLGDAASEAAANASDLNNELQGANVNIPAGFKLALSRFRSIQQPPTEAESVVFAGQPAAMRGAAPPLGGPTGALGGVSENLSKAVSALEELASEPRTQTMNIGELNLDVEDLPSFVAALEDETEKRSFNETGRTFILATARVF